jgi:hypothetical protein
MSNMQRIFVTEVHNFGGFFGGDTVTLSATPWPEGAETTLTIDEKAFENVQDRHMIAPEMVLDIELAGERVDRARVLGARDWDVLKQTFGDVRPTASLDAPHMRAYHCPTCNLWLLGQPVNEAERMACTLCHQPLS